jgi:hypothetical protein
MPSARVTSEVFAQRWLHRIPMPFGPAERDAGYWWECSMRQVEVSRTIVFDAPRRARWFFEALTRSGCAPMTSPRRWGTPSLDGGGREMNDVMTLLAERGPPADHSPSATRPQAGGT